MGIQIVVLPEVKQENTFRVPESLGSHVSNSDPNSAHL